jgi:hypothetical protein
MKICTTLRLAPPTGEVVSVGFGENVADAQVIDAQIVDVSTVPDDHQFGPDDDGLLHVEGKIVAEDLRIEP